MNERIIQRLDEHIVEAHRQLCQSVDGGVFERGKDWARGYTGSTIFTFNLLLLLADRALSDDLLSDAAAYFDERRVPHVVAFDEHRLSKGARFLHSRRYQPLPPQPGMVLFGPPRRLRIHPDLAVERVGTVAAISAYCTLVSELFGLPLAETMRLFPIDQLRNDAIRHYVGYLDEVPVVVGTGVVAEGIVSVWNVATRDDVRRQGAATALMERLLGDAWEDGCDLSVLYSSPMAYSLYQKLGYELYTQRLCFLPPEG
jgi:ribosomal protein S18 acetylase RimI-like enzyme